MNGSFLKPRPVHETVIGSVLPNSWDNEYRVTGVVIACESERDLEVINFSSHPELSRLCRAMVAVTGIVRVLGDREEIQVEKVRVLDGDTKLAPNNQRSIR